jgi:mannobiose 2-epimerase
MGKQTTTIALLLILFIASCSDKKETERKLHQMREEILSDLITNVLPFWEIYSPDPAGGFYGTILNNGLPVPQADKALVLNARILWAFSSAYRTFEVKHYKQFADRAQKYIIDHFIDPEYGGAYWLVNAEGIPLDTNKHTCGIAFAIHALSEHYRATGNKESLEQAIALYNTLQEHAYDPVNGGYIDSFTRNWQLPEHFGYDGKTLTPKTMSTHLHILEAFTNLYRVWPDKQLKKQLKRLVTLFYNEIDSYAHDIQLSWLLYEAVKIIGDDRLLEQTKQTVIHLVDTQIAEAWNPQGYISLEKSSGESSKNVEWWPQAEAVIALINAWQISNDPKYATTALTTWNWIKQNLVDSEYGEWYYCLDKNIMPITTLPKANIWKGPYHNTRMAFETLRRIRWQEVPD